MTRRFAIIGDIHGCLDELRELHSLLLAEGIKEFFHLGDLVDRGPDSAGVVRFCRENNFNGVMGNHEASLLSVINRMARVDFDPQSLTAAKRERMAIAKELSAADLTFIRALPKLHVMDDFNLVLVHGGLFPGRALHEQDKTVLFMQVIHPERPGDLRWTSRKDEYTLEQSRSAGYSPWQELYNGAERVVYGHSVFDAPSIQGLTTGIDTGCVFGGALTALIIPDERFIQVKAKRQYSIRQQGYDS